MKKMIQFIVRAYDGEGRLPKRMEVRPRHFENMERMNVVILDKKIIKERI